MFTVEANLVGAVEDILVEDLVASLAEAAGDSLVVVAANLAAVAEANPAEAAANLAVAVVPSPVGAAANLAEAVANLVADHRIAAGHRCHLRD